MPDPNPIVAQVFEANPRPSVIVVRPGALGDTILTLPTLNYLKTCSPDVKITLCGSHWADKLMVMARGLDSYFPFDSARMTPLFTSGPIVKAPRVFREANLILLYTAETDGHFVRHVMTCRDGPTIVWNLTPPTGTHMALHMVRAVAGSLPRCVEQLPPPELQAPRTGGQGLKGDHNGELAIVHPGSGSAAKNLSPRIFARIVSLLRSEGMRPVLLQGPADEAACRDVLNELAPDVRPAVLRDMHLHETADTLQDAGMFVGNDSGVSHLAAALGVKTRVLFRSTDPVVWRPLGADVKAFTIRAEDAIPELLL